MPKVFISYRRRDTDYAAGRLREHLIQALGQDRVFFDIDNIPLGTDFRSTIQEALNSAEVALILIGPNWFGAADAATGLRRLDAESDNVRIEVEMALQLKLRVIPVLLDGAVMPKATELPASMSALAYQNGLGVRPDPDFGPDMQRLLRSLQQHKENASAPALPTPESGEEKPPKTKPSPKPTASRPENIEDEFLSPRPGIVIGTSKRSEVLSLVGQSSRQESLLMSFSYSFDFNEQGTLIGYTADTEESPFFSSVAKHLKRTNMKKLMTRLEQLGYKLRTQGPAPVGQWFEFWKSDRYCHLWGERMLGNGQTAKVFAHFVADHLQKLHDSPPKYILVSLEKTKA